MPFISSQTSFGIDEASDMTKYSADAKPETGHGNDYVTCLTQWTDEVTYKYLDVALTTDLKNNPLPEVVDLDLPITYMADIRLEESDDKSLHGTSPRSDFLNFSSTASDCSRTNEESEEEDKSCLEHENKILQDYDQAKTSRALLSEVPVKKIFTAVYVVVFLIEVKSYFIRARQEVNSVMLIVSENEDGGCVSTTI